MLLDFYNLTAVEKLTTGLPKNITPALRLIKSTYCYLLYKCLRMCLGLPMQNVQEFTVYNKLFKRIFGLITQSSVTPRYAVLSRKLLNVWRRTAQIVSWYIM